MPPGSLLLIELNEINFEFVRAYIARGLLPNFAHLIRKHGVAETTSENQYDHIEPWIQWVTAHTGLTLSQHGIFRLGDIVNADLPQIWEELEAKGLKVGAISPMNGKNRTRNAEFFIPDPWTSTRIAGPFLLRQLYAAIAQVVNDNAQSKIKFGSMVALLAGALAYARMENYGMYSRLVTQARSRPWFKAMFLDLLLADIFIKCVQNKKPNFASLFLNAGAHIQHHYLFSSSVYAGAERNPEWYIPSGVDPILDVYAIYDRIIGQIIRTFGASRLMLATGLHQNPHISNTFYWRLKSHGKFLSKIGVSFSKAEPRMSRDFIIVCATAEQAGDAERLLKTAVAKNDGLPLFEVDNRGVELFVMLTYPKDIGSGFEFGVDGKIFGNFRDDVVFVAIKNGEHDGTGYFIDSGVSLGERFSKRFPLAELPSMIKEALQVHTLMR